MALKLTPRLVLLFTLFATLLLGGLGGLIYASARASLRDAVEAGLYSTALEKAAALGSWLDDRQADLVGISRSPTIIRLTDSLDGVTSAPHDALVAELQVRSDEHRSFLRLFMLSPDTGHVTASTVQPDEGASHEQAAYFLKGRGAPYIGNVQHLGEQGHATLFVSAPLRTAAGKLVGVLVGELNINELTRIIRRHAGLRASEDAYLMDLSSRLVTQPLLSANQAEIQTPASQRCLAGESGVLLDRDYRGVPTISRYAWLDAQQLCLIVEIDQSDAFAPADALGRQIVLIGAAMLVLGLLVSLLLARTITAPILALQAGVARFTAGERNLRLPDSAPDEVGALCRSFNQMIATLSAQEAELKRYTVGLEQLIAARTQDLRESEERYRSAFEQAAVGIAHVALDGSFLRLNQRYCAIVGYSQAEMAAMTIPRITPPDEREARPGLVQELLDGERSQYRVETRYLHKDGRLVWVHLSVSLMRDVEGRPSYFIAIIEDISEHKRIADELQARTEALLRSNAELEQFAYVASHDLQEPLRMVSSFTQLLARRYRGRLDADANEFIGFAVDGATRMQKLINDLLTYSRVGTRGRPFAPVDCAAILAHVLSDLSLAIAESGGAVTHTEMPVLLGDETQLAQLFQNLIGNALKFHGADPPRVRVAAERCNEGWRFMVRDNGIGIEPAYYERVFVIFQRLHTRDEYPGTGIGLAICKKIVGRHGGRIWLESTPGAGTTFFFTLAASPVPLPVYTGDAESLSSGRPMECSGALQPSREEHHEPHPDPDLAD